jgi:hypothetical protein
MVFNRFAAYACNGGMSIEKAAPRKKPKTTRFAGYAGVDEEGFIPNEKRELTKRDQVGITTRDIDNPYYKMIDEEALALQQLTGESYAACFTKCYTAPQNKTIVDQMHYEHLAQNYDAMFGYGLATPVKKAAPPDAVEDDVDASRRGDPGSARAELHRRVGEHMRDNPGMSYERSFVAIYLDPNNRSLKDRVDQESVQHARRLNPGAKPFPPYTSPGHRGVNAASNIGHEGKGGEDY